MEKQFWLDRWEARQIGFHLSEVNAHLHRHWSALKLRSDARVLVPLCGKSLDLLWLHEAGYAVVGVELSPVAVREFFADNGLAMQTEAEGVYTSRQAPEIQIRQMDFFDLQPESLGDVQAFYDRAALVALPADMRKTYVEHLAILLQAGATGLLVTMDYPQDEMDGPPFSVTAEEVLALYSTAFHVQLLDSLDVLAGNERLARRGLTRMVEQIWRLERK